MSLPELALIPVLVPIPTLVLVPPFLRQALVLAILRSNLAVNWERIKKFRSMLQAKYIEIYSRYKE